MNTDAEVGVTRPPTAHRGGDRKTKATVAAVWPQAKESEKCFESQKLRGKKGFSCGTHRRSTGCQHLDLGLLAFRTMRE